MSGPHIGQETGYFSPEGNGLPSVDININDLLSVIANERRRIVIAILAEVGADGIEMGDLSEQVAARQEGKPVAQVARKERRSVYVGLKQTHLQQIEEVGLLEMVDREAEFVPTTDTIGVAEIIEALNDTAGGDE